MVLGALQLELFEIVGQFMYMDDGEKKQEFINDIQALINKYIEFKKMI